jgi:branched-chain amino acid aminotransferase
LNPQQVAVLRAISAPNRVEWRGELVARTGRIAVNIPIGVIRGGTVDAAPYTATSLADAAAKEPQGVYTVGRTYDRDHVLLLDQHFDRLERSARLEGIPVALDRAAVRKALRTLIDQSGYVESRFRITIPRHAPDQPIISLEPFKPVPPEIIENGAQVVTVQMARRNPAAKTTEWMSERKSAIDSFTPGIYEGILVSVEGTMLEGTNSNFYAIKGETLYTADDASVLSGIARQILLNVAQDVLPVQLRPVHVDEIPTLNEALLTSSGRGVVPIVEIDGQSIGDGRPGAYTTRLREAYNAWSKAHLEPI